MKPLDLDLHMLAQLLVERAERFVHQDDRGLVDEAAGKGHALLLPARELTRKSLRQVAEMHHLERGGDPLGDFRRRPARIFSGKAMFSATVRCGKSA